MLESGRFSRKVDPTLGVTANQRLFPAPEGNPENTMIPSQGDWIFQGKLKHVFVVGLSFISRQFVNRNPFQRDLSKDNINPDTTAAFCLMGKLILLCALFPCACQNQFSASESAFYSFFLYAHMHTHIHIHRQHLLHNSRSRGAAVVRGGAVIVGVGTSYGDTRICLVRFSGPFHPRNRAVCGWWICGE